MPTRYLFDTGPEGTQLTPANTGLTSFIRDSPSTQVFAADAAHNGAFGARYTSTNAASLGRLAVDANNVQALSFWMKTPAILPPSGLLTMMTVRNTGASAVGRFGWLSAGTMQFLDAAQTTNFFTTTPGGATRYVFNTSTWYRVEARFNGGSTTTSSFTINIYDVSGTLLATATATAANLTASAIASYDIGIGAGNASEMSIAIDDLQVEPGRTTEIGAYVPGSNTPPTVTASSTQSTTTPNATVPLAAAATDADGTIASYKWDFQSVPSGVTAPTITNSTSANATFVPTSAGIYRARVTVTDNNGATGVGTVDIFVGGTSVSVISTTSNAGAWVSTPSASGLVSVLSDADSATIAESPASPATAAKMRMRLGPLQPLQTFTLVLAGLAVTGAGGLAITAELFEGTTSRKKWTGISATGADVQLTLTSAEIATIGNWNALDVELAAVAA